ncbi:WD40 repeat protein [Pyrenophora tritici-repentis]|uniref:Mitochondrial division protein 1 n=1 Tax=Pyrenophora tritici-repentis TaxID=45151 RepID=A0A834SA42_9PLEO|nr:WD40 repeat protein [Pyrenophora tritici-repentis]
MAGLSSLLRESGRSSKPHDPNAKSFLTLPAELRNRIYDLLFESKERMRVIFSKTHKSEDEITGTHFRSKTGSAVALFSTYKKILKEAAPVLYTRNTFILSQEKAPMLRIGSHKKVGAVGPFQTWISTIGSNAQLLRHVTLDVYATCYDENYFYPRWSGQIDETGVLDVLGILQVLWSADLTLEMSFIVATCLSDSSWDRSYNVAAMTRNFHALRDDQLNLRRYLPLLDAVHLNLNGSGGLILWYTSANHASEDKYPQIWHEPTYTSKIVSGDDDANRLSIIERKSPMTLMGLPHYLLTKIWSDVILPPEGITVDLDTETHFKNEATYTNRRLYKEWRGLFLNLNPLTAKMTTSTVRSDFSNFTKLRQLLRTAFSSTNSTYTDSTLQLQAGFEMILDFRLGQLAALEDLRVSVLILVLESCHVPANSTIRIRLWRLDSVYVTDQVVIGLEQLRRKVVAALEEFVKSDTHKAAPEIWINADGQVVEVVEKPAPNREDPLMPMPEMASQVRPRNSISNGGASGQADGNPSVTLTSPSPRAGASGVLGNLPFHPSVRQEALNAPFYDIIPTIAAPHSTSINAITATPDMRWVFSGGADGYIRKFNWVDTANGKLALTVAQRHPFVDSVTKAGVLLSYWENEDTAGGSETLSPVYSLAVHHQALWLLSGLDSGGINLQSVRHQEGTRIHTLKNHTSAVSVLTLSQDETSVLSGSWDKTINDWDLNTGQVKRKFETSGSQISAIEQRPLSTLPIPQDTETLPQANGTFSSNNSARPRANGSLPNGLDTKPAAQKDEGAEDAQGSPDDSLFGDKDQDSLFGDGQENNLSATMPSFGDDDDEFSRAIANGIQQADEDANVDLDMMDMGGPVQEPQEAANEVLKEPPAAAEAQPATNGTAESQPNGTANGLPHAEDIEKPINTVSQTEQPASSETTFMDASIDGTLRIWDRRQPNPVARITPPRNTPPWCMNACWSPDGNFIYAGRRNGTVDEYSLHKSLREPRRTFRFPSVSGAVSAVRAMPNGRHLVCASYDILRMYDLSHDDGGTKVGAAATPFLIVPGHRTGVISQLYLDPTCNFMISTGGNRGWEGASTEVMLGYEIGIGS